MAAADRSGVAARARAWRDGAQARICDVLEPWEHGTVRRAARYPGYYDYNAVRVDGDPHMSVEELIGFSDRALAGLAHRRIDIDEPAVAERYRPGFEALGWRATRLLWMRHEAPPPPGPDVAVAQVAFDAVYELREIWALEEFPTEDFAAHYADAREVALTRDAKVLAVREDSHLIAFAQVERDAHNAEISQVFVHPDHRDGGRGTAMTRAAIIASQDADDLWIVADDDDRPKQLYARLGFQPAWTTMEFLRLPRRPIRAQATDGAPSGS